MQPTLLTFLILLTLLPILTLGQFIAGTITPNSFIISQDCPYAFIFYRNNNPVTSEFISPVLAVPATAYIEIKFPTAYTRVSTVTNPVCFNTQTGVTLSCTVNLQNNVVTITGLFGNNSTQTAEILSVTVNSIRNPIRAETSGNFQYYIKRADGTVIDQSPAATSGVYSTAITFLPASFTCAVSANGNYISTRSRLTITITTTNPIPANGLLVIDFPLYWAGDLDQSTTITSNPLCASITGLATLSCSYLTYTSPINIARIFVSSLSVSGIAAGAQLVFDVSSVLTPPYTNYISQVQISSQWQDGVQIDTCTSNIANTVPIPFRTVAFNVQSGTTVVQSKFTAKLDLTLARSFSSQDQVALFIPNNFLTNNQINITSSNFPIFSVTVQSSANNNGTTKVILSNFPASPSVLPANNIFTLFLRDIFNFISVQPQSITIVFSRQGEQYQSSSTTYTATIGTFTSFGLTSDSTVVNHVGESLATVVSQFRVSTGSYVEIVYNSAVNAQDMPQSAISYAALNGLRVNNVTYGVSSSVITVANVFQNTFTSGNIEVRIPQLTNPPTARPTPYTLTIKTSTGFAIATAVFTFTADLQVFKTAATLTASSYKVMDTGIIYTFSFETFYAYRSISILVPPEVSTNTGFETTCTPNTYTSCFIQSVNGSAYKNITFMGTTAAGVQTISWGSNTNPNSFKPTSSFQLYTYLNGWGVERSSGYVILTMTQQSTVLSAQAVPSSYTNDATIDVKIDYILPALSPSGTITITVPIVLDITGSTCSGTNIGTCTIIPPRIVITFTNSDPTTTHASSLTLANTKNAPSFKPIPTFSITLVTSDNYNSLTSTIAAWSNIQLSSFTTAVSSNIGYRGENALFTFNLAGLSGKQTYVNIKININFGMLNASTTPISSELVNGYEVRYNILGEGTSQKSFTLQAPIYIGDYTFSLKTYTSDEFPMGQSVSNVWRHSCYGTECRACTGTACLNCYNSTLTQFSIFNTADSTCIRACQQGFYLQPNTTNCMPCSSSCLQCTSTSTTCTKCKTDSTTTPPTLFYLNPIFSTCGTQCPLTYYPNSLTQQCSPCVPPCYTCANDNICNTCVNGYYLLALSSACLQTCPANVMVPNDVNKTCDFCSANCLTCSVFVYNCTSCNNTLGLYLDGNTCVTNCSTQKFLKNNICTSCELPCRICHNSTTTCSSCFPNSTLFLWYDFKCISASQCAIGHYINSVNGSCDACPLQCTKCTSLTSCSMCASGFYLFGTSCSMACPNTAYKNDSAGTCDPCVGCLTCNSVSVCTSCRTTEFLYLATCYSVCPSDTYPSSESLTANTSRAICVVCPIGCPTCVNSTFCLTCLASQYIYQGVCYTDCPVTTYPSYPRCLNCPVTCHNCTSPTNCLSCATNYSLENSQCVLNCAVGISYQQVCYPCGLNCALCNGTTCTRCSPFYYLLNNVCMSQCSQNTLTLDNATCVPCTEKFVNCTTCSQTQCLSCMEGELTGGQCLPCTPGFYTLNSHCVACPSVCKVCRDPTYCTSCADGFYSQANYCVSVCPNNKIPNGTKCDVCIPDCSKCDLATSLCSICVANMYMLQGTCFSVCPDPYVINLNYTLCITKQQYSIQYSKASKPIYFPFSIAALIVISISIGLKCYIKSMHIVTFLVGVVGWIELASWILFGVIEYLFYTNQQLNALKGIVLVLAGLAALVVTNFVFLRFYFKYFVEDSEFVKWERKHCCINIVFLLFGTIISFRLHRLIYSKVMDRDQLSLILSSPKKLIPISILSVISILVSAGPVIVGTCLAVYYSLTQDQQFFNALDTIVVTGIMVILMLLDLKHGHDYFIDELETQNIRNKIYQEDYEEFSINNKRSEKYKEGEFQKGSDLSRENLVEGGETSNVLDNMTTAKKFRGNPNSKQKIEEGQMDQTMRQTGGLGRKKVSASNLDVEQSKDNLLNAQNEYKQQQIFQQSEQPPVSQQKKWVQKQYDHFGYQIKYDKDNNIIRYDKNGNRVEIDQNGKHKSYDQNGFEVKQDPLTGKLAKYDSDGFRVGDDGLRYDGRGYRIVKSVGEDGMPLYKYYDQNGYEVVKDEQTGEESKVDSHGNKVIIDPETKEHTVYNKDGYQVFYGKNGDPDKYKNQAGQYVRYNPRTKNWEQYDPSDGFLLKKNPTTGEYEKYDEHGFRVEKDQYGNLYRYDADGNRVVLGLDGEVKKYDKEGYEIKKDPLTGEEHKFDKDGYEVKIDPQTGHKTFYDQHGYRVERDFYGKVTLYDEHGNMVIIDPVTKKHRKFNKEGLEIVDDGRGGTFLKDKRNRRVVELQDGYYEKYDEEGNKIWLDQDGYEVQTDQNGNIVKYDKIGDKVEQDEDQDIIQNKQDGWQLDEGTADNAMSPTKAKNTKNPKFKIQKQYNYQQEYSKMLQDSKPHLLFDFQAEQEQQNLKQFHDVEPATEYELEKEYQTLYNNEAQKQYMMRTDSMDRMKVKLEELEQVDNSPYKNLKEKIKKGRNKTGLSKEEEPDNEDIMIEPETVQDKLEMKSVADMSVSQRSFVNEGVKPLTDQSRNEEEDMESIGEIDAIGMNIKKNRNNRRSDANFNKAKNNVNGNRSQNSKEGTRSENNYLPNKNASNTSRVKKEEAGRKIFDSDQEVQSLGEEQWQNEGADIFYKDHHSNAKTNTHDKGLQMQEHSDILSDYIPQQPIEQGHAHKASQENLMHRKYMQSIEEVQDELFDKLKSEDNRVKRTDFKLSGTPNPLVQYAKTIDVKKMQEQKDKDKVRKGRYPQNRNTRR